MAQAEQQQPVPSTTKDQDLVDLQPDKQSIVKRLLAPKVIILGFLSLMFISRNIYNMINAPKSQQPPKQVPHTPPREDDPLMDRLYGYVILTVVLFILYMILVRVNDNALIKKMQQQKKKKQEEQTTKNLQIHKHKNQESHITNNLSSIPEQKNQEETQQLKKKQ